MRHQRLTATFAVAAFAAVAAVSSGAEFAPAPEGTFSIVVIPDTQDYRDADGKKNSGQDERLINPVFGAYVDWVTDNIHRQRIVFVSHVGDIVDENKRKQWVVARRLMDRLHGRVPYGISVGNHDMTEKGKSELFQEFFPASRFQHFDWYGGWFPTRSSETEISGNNANSFQLFSAGGMDFVFLHLECNAPDDVLAWASRVLRQHSDRRAIVTSHMGLGPRKKPKKAKDYFEAPKGRMTWKKCHGKRGNSPQDMWDKCFRRHANLFMICCGDQSRTQAMRQAVRGDGGNTVHEVLSDYGANGLRVMRFVPAKNRIEVRTWNPFKNDFCRGTEIVPNENQHQFVLDYAMWSRSSN